MCTYDLEGLCDGVFMNSGFEAKTKNGSCSTSSLVLDGQRGELVEATVSVGRKGVSAERSSEALKRFAKMSQNSEENSVCGLLHVFIVLMSLSSADLVLGTTELNHFRSQSLLSAETRSLEYSHAFARQHGLVTHLKFK